jgi:hypothetical protein
VIVRVDQANTPRLYTFYVRQSASRPEFIAQHDRQGKNHCWTCSCPDFKPSPRINSRPHHCKHLHELVRMAAEARGVLRLVNWIRATTPAPLDQEQLRNAE